MTPEEIAAELMATVARNTPARIAQREREERSAPVIRREVVRRKRTAALAEERERQRQERAAERERQRTERAAARTAAEAELKRVKAERAERMRAAVERQRQRDASKAA
ncbi:hypothetical protein [Streptomyces sp. NPDC018000]|uniref:hypothetical protein n=1 Tax=Streptomyces sp. NPDC018000 TaxID=3365028 RepID=UPI0037A0E513